MSEPLTPERVFLDANVLFSAALGGESFAALWARVRAGTVTVCTSPQCVDEVRRNLTAKRPQAVPRLEALLTEVHLVAAPRALLPWTEGKMPEDDAWVVAAAVDAGAQVLLSGNTKHFGWLMGRDDLPLRVCTVRAWLER